MTWLTSLTSDAKEALAEQFPEMEKEIGDAVYDLVKSDMRTMILKEKKRIDGRALDEVRSVTCESQHCHAPMGLRFFTRGQTQALCVATLGTKPDERMTDDLRGKSFKSYYLTIISPHIAWGKCDLERRAGSTRYRSWSFGRTGN